MQCLMYLLFRKRCASFCFVPTQSKRGTKKERQKEFVKEYEMFSFYKFIWHHCFAKEIYQLWFLED